MPVAPVVVVAHTCFLARGDSRASKEVLSRLELTPTARRCSGRWFCIFGLFFGHGWRSGNAAACKAVIHGFESHPVLHKFRAHQKQSLPVSQITDLGRTSVQHQGWITGKQLSGCCSDLQFQAILFNRWRQHVNLRPCIKHYPSAPPPVSFWLYFQNGIT